ncbi:hypothetical protein BLNAU_11901 [Blattamonas nauphoetae]|uniref:Transmembrane protein n=1 Tax=Blattamonas nauphoetae TaxID=2049346 RepID=A0ABQ9XM39_9EUKA|nr:hypothetical protein BLNAU_11901 [Blattamonas nauphoetae]
MLLVLLLYVVHSEENIHPSRNRESYEFKVSPSHFGDDCTIVRTNPCKGIISPLKTYLPEASSITFVLIDESSELSISNANLTNQTLVIKSESRDDHKFNVTFSENSIVLFQLDQQSTLDISSVTFVLPSLDRLVSYVTTASSPTGDPVERSIVAFRDTKFVPSPTDSQEFYRFYIATVNNLNILLESVIVRDFRFADGGFLLLQSNGTVTFNGSTLYNLTLNQDRSSLIQTDSSSSHISVLSSEGSGDDTHYSHFSQISIPKSTASVRNEDQYGYMINLESLEKFTFKFSSFRSITTSYDGIVFISNTPSTFENCSFSTITCATGSCVVLTQCPVEFKFCSFAQITSEQGNSAAFQLNKVYQKCNVIQSSFVFCRGQRAGAIFLNDEFNDTEVTAQFTENIFINNLATTGEQNGNDITLEEGTDVLFVNTDSISLSATPQVRNGSRPADVFHLPTPVVDGNSVDEGLTCLLPGHTCQCFSNFLAPKMTRRDMSVEVKPSTVREWHIDVDYHELEIFGTDRDNTFIIAAHTANTTLIEINSGRLSISTMTIARRSFDTHLPFLVLGRDDEGESGLSRSAKFHNCCIVDERFTSDTTFSIERCTFDILNCQFIIDFPSESTEASHNSLFLAHRHPRPNADEYRCSWTGSFVFANSNTTISSSSFTGFSQGALSLDNSTVSIHQTVIQDSNPHIPYFGQVRHNIDCKDSKVDITTSASGAANDAQMDTAAFGDDSSLWIANTNCTVSVNGVDVKQTLIQPAIGSVSFTATDNADVFQMALVGGPFVPCALSVRLSLVSDADSVNLSTSPEINTLSTDRMLTATVSELLNHKSASKKDARFDVQVFQGSHLVGKADVTDAVRAMRKPPSPQSSSSPYVAANVLLLLLTVVVLVCAIGFCVLVIRRSHSTDETLLAAKIHEEVMESGTTNQQLRSTFDEEPPSHGFTGDIDDKPEPEPSTEEEDISAICCDQASDYGAMKDKIVDYPAYEDTDMAKLSADHTICNNVEYDACTTITFANMYVEFDLVGQQSLNETIHECTINSPKRLSIGTYAACYKDFTDETERPSLSRVECCTICDWYRGYVMVPYEYKLTEEGVTYTKYSSYCACSSIYRTTNITVTSRHRAIYPELKGAKTFFWKCVDNVPVPFAVECEQPGVLYELLKSNGFCIQKSSSGSTWLIVLLIVVAVIVLSVIFCIFESQVARERTDVFKELIQKQKDLAAVEEKETRENRQKERAKEKLEKKTQ